MITRWRNAMVMTLTPELKAALKERASQEGIAPEVLALKILQERLIASVKAVELRDEWEPLIVQVGTNCGVSLPHDALSSEGLYESWPT
jgi:hypothetical protein